MNRDDASKGPGDDRPTDAWYAGGLRFTCTQCGDCCTGEPGFVWVDREEISKLAAAVGESDLDRFERIYLRKIGARWSLKELPSGDCVFFDGERRRCTVYAARPTQCRTWPFWSSNVASPEQWKETCKDCPGSGKGRLYALNEITQLCNKTRL